jgi:signal transduction histidine kinase
MPRLQLPKAFLELFSKYPGLFIAAVAFVSNLFVVGLIAISLQDSYRQYYGRAESTSRNTDRLVAQSIEGEIDRIDMGLRAVQDEYVRLQRAPQGDWLGLHDFLKRQRARLPMTDSLRIADSKGEVRWGSDERLPNGISVADRDYFELLRRSPDTGLAISKPVLGRISSKWVLVFARRVETPSGDFAGVIYAPVTIEWFQQKFTRLEVGPSGAVVLRGNASRDFDLLARFPEAGFVGQTKVSDQFRATITAHPQGGTYEAYAGADNVQRIFSYQAVGSYPLITLVGLATDDTLVEWRHEVGELGLQVAAFVLLTSLGAFIVFKAWKARANAFDEVRTLNAELREDIEARLRAEVEITKLNAELEARVRSRTGELEAANRDLEAFAYSTSHDLRAPLRALAGYSHILLAEEGECLSSDGKQMLDRISHNTAKMEKLIDDILEYSRAGRQTPIRRVTDLAALARDVANGLATNYPAAKFEIEQMPLALCDPTMIEQVVQNLLSNALKYSSKVAEPHVHMGATKIDGSTAYFVKDNGAGFDMRYADKLFGMFQRMHGEQEFPGTGVGLAIVKRLLEKQGGRIWATAEVGKGATFFFSLELADDAVA